MKTNLLEICNQCWQIFTLLNMEIEREAIVDIIIIIYYYILIIYRRNNSNSGLARRLMA